MKENKSISISIGGGFSGALTIAFIILKLCHVIDWSWVWVLSPLWISASIIVLVLVLLIILIVFFISSRKR